MQGFVVDLVSKHLAKMLNFTPEYKFYDKHGNEDKETGQWNGCIKALMDGV